MDKLERVARAICAEKCAFMGEPPCYTVEGEWPNPNCQEPGCHAEAQAAIAALEPMDKPRVKPLDWTKKGYAETPFGKYLVVREDWSGQEDFWFVCFAGKPYGKCGEHSSEEAAKAAAQADYEARILAAIEPAPQEPEKYTIGNLTMDRVFQAAELTNVSDMQAVFDQVEVALRHAIEPAPVSVREAARVLYDMPETDRMKAWRATRDAPPEFAKWFCVALRAIAEAEG